MICFSDIGGTASYATYIRANFAYQSSNPKSVIFKVLQFSETVLTVDEGIPSGALTYSSPCRRYAPETAAYRQISKALPLSVCA